MRGYFPPKHSTTSRPQVRAASDPCPPTTRLDRGFLLGFTLPTLATKDAPRPQRRPVASPPATLRHNGCHAQNFPLLLPNALRTSLLRYAGVAQSVEQGTENPRVGSSILSPGTMNDQGRDERPFSFPTKAQPDRRRSIQISSCQRQRFSLNANFLTPG